MNYKIIKKWLLGLAVGFFSASLIFTAGCAPKKIKVVYDQEGDSGYSEESHRHKKGGPPAHAPAHGYRAKYQYRYYPECSVYYDDGRKIYFYIKGDHWEVGASLPYHLRVSLGDFVHIEMETDKPYVHHAEHVKKHPPGHMKKQHKPKKKHKWG